MANGPEVSILYYTGKDTPDEKMYGARLLAYTKNTRLQMTPDGYEKFRNKPVDAILKEIEYMSNTIPSSWEFVDVIFAINKVSRACAQQITRTRTASFAMQSQRVTDMRDVTWHVPETVKDKDSYNLAIEGGISDYATLVIDDESLEDARGVLPINVHCNLIAKYNLRSLVDLLRARESYRVQGEYREVAQQMKAALLSVWPWAAPFFVPPNEKAIKLIESVAEALPYEQKMQLAKAADLLKKG